MFKNIWGWNPENIKERSASNEKFDVLIKECTVIHIFFTGSKMESNVFIKNISIKFEGKKKLAWRLTFFFYFDQ